MIAINRILCPVDFSQYSRHALEHAVAIARWYEAPLTVLHVIAPVVPPVADPYSVLYPPIVFTPADLEQFRAATDQWVGAHDGVATTTVVREGSAAGEIVRLANEMPADFVVIGTHGRSGFEHLMLGSVTNRVLRKANCPVLTVPPHNVSPAPAAGGLFKRILCAVDFSPASMKAMAYAASLAEEADAELLTLHVLEQHVFEPTAMPGELMAWQANARTAALQRQRESIPVDVNTYAGVEHLVLSGKPYREILQVAGERHTQLIVMGVHGGAIGAIAFGSTTDHVLREARCPVLTLRA